MEANRFPSVKANEIAAAIRTIAYMPRKNAVSLSTFRKAFSEMAWLELTADTSILAANAPGMMRTANTLPKTVM